VDHSYDPFYAPIQMPDGTWVYGSAAYNHRTKSAGGPSALIGLGIQAVLDHVNAMAPQPKNVIQFPQRKAA
jgi:hypothetical protein